MCQRRRCARAPPNRPRPRQTTSEPTAHRRDGAMATTATATATATAMNARHTNRARRVRTRRRPHASTSVVGVRSRRLVRRDTFKHGPSAPPHQSRTRQLTSWRHLATRTHRARIAHRRSRVRRTFVSHFAVVESPSSSHARRGARARLWRVFKHRRSRSGACEWVERARACRSR